MAVAAYDVAVKMRPRDKITPAKARDGEELGVKNTARFPASHG